MKKIDRVPESPKEFVNFIKYSDRKVYIFGADIAGKVLLKLLVEAGVSVEAYIDNNKNKCGIDIEGVPVLPATDALSYIDKESVFLIASTYIADIIRQLEDLGFYQWCPIVQFIKQHESGYYNNLLVGDLRKNHSGGEFTADFDIFVLENMINSQQKYLNENLLFIRSVDLIITEKCSLKCVDCSNLMQYYEKPIDISYQELCNDLDDLCEIADEINEVRIIGGDPLMNKDFHKIISYAANKNKVNKVVVYTNGTISPSVEKIIAIADPKVFIFITTYGNLSKKTEPLKALLKKFGIPFNCQPAYGWTDCASIEDQRRTEANLSETFKNCCAKHFTTITMGRLFRCPFSANVERLSAIPDIPEDFIEIRGYTKLKDHEKVARKRLLWNFLRNKAYIGACNFCKGRTYGDPEITPGIQTKTVIQYHKFARNKADVVL